MDEASCDEHEQTALPSPPITNSKVNFNDEKKFKRGIVYISFIPPGITPTLLRNLLTIHAPVGRLYLQVVKDKHSKSKNKKYKADSFTEGWVEFLKKRHAKKIAELLNNTPIGGKRRDLRDYNWSLRYLPRFKWVHLVERLNYESAVFKQRMRNEISQAKRVANIFKDNVEKEERLRRKKKTQDVNKPESSMPITPRNFSQRSTENEINKKKKQDERREEFLKNLFA